MKMPVKHIINVCTETLTFEVFSKKTPKTRLSRFLKIEESRLRRDDCFKNESNAVFGVFLQRLTIANAQTGSKVRGEEAASPDELEKQKIETNQILPLKNEYDALRIIKPMPNWTPGTQKGKNVRVSMKQIINFVPH